MEDTFNKAIVAASKKEYSDFKAVATEVVEDKIKRHLSGFMSNLEKHAFEKEK